MSEFLTQSRIAAKARKGQSSFVCFERVHNVD
jgi:hypothetical protein